MPFIIRKIEPRYIGRGHVPQDTTCAEVWPVGAELGAITNGVLACTLKQLASLLANAEDIFSGLTSQLTDVADRSGSLRRRIDQLDHRLSTIDPKKIPVPESDICSFATRTIHFHASHSPTTDLFVPVTRPQALKELYDAAAVIAVKSLDSLRRERDASSAVEMYLCTPVLGKRRRDQSFDIESRVPAILDDLRRWTSSEALGDVTTPPDCMSRILQSPNSDQAIDHKLPSPEERVQTIAMKFPAEIVAVDVSGRGFARMSMRRRSLGGCQSGPTTKGDDASVVKRRSRVRKSRGKRRNTIAGTDGNEIKKAITDQSAGNPSGLNTAAAAATAAREQSLSPKLTGRAYRSASTDILGDKKDSTEIKWNFDALKAWGKSRLKRINPKTDTDNNRSSESTANCQAYTQNGYEHKKDEMNERKPSLSSLSSKSVASSIVLSTHTSNRQSGVRLRESAAQRRERRKGNRDDPPHSSSGNWSASSESGRASIGSESTTTNPSRSVATGTCSTKLMLQSQAKRFKARDTSTSSSVTSEGTLTPDIIQDIGVIPFSDEIEGEGETCSIYSCDTEGYYTSFHMDSGLKTLREEELTAVAQHNSLGKPSGTNYDIASPVAENEYELFGRGSTSTTTSSAGTVCTALMAPAPPERKSSLTVVAMVHGQNTSGGESPDSGHNTSSSPVESASSPACYTARSCSELEYSESSDLEGFDRIERIRSKTAISTSRIPSMCVITPPGSDDEQQQLNGDGNSENTGAHVLMSATVGTSKMEVINGQDKNLYATVQTVASKINPSQDTARPQAIRTSPLSGMLDKIRGVLPLARKSSKAEPQFPVDSGDYVTIADVRNNNDKCQSDDPNNMPTYANAHLVDQLQRDSDYVSLSELPKKYDSSLERKRQGARVTLDSEGKVIYSSDSLKRRKGSHTTFNPGPFVREASVSPNVARSPKPRRIKAQIRAPKPDLNDENAKIRANKSPERENSDRQRALRGAYVNIQKEEGNSLLALPGETTMRTMAPKSPLDGQNHPRHPDQLHPHDSVQMKIFATQKYHTMPYERSAREYSSSVPRSITPDLTSQLENKDLWNDRGKASQPPRDTGSERNCRQILTSNSSNLQNRYYSTLGIPSTAYRFYASTPVNAQKENQCRSIEALHSPITSGRSNEFSGALEFSEVDGRNSNVPLPKKGKSTMSNDELFTAIYKSKRKLNIQHEPQAVALDNNSGSHVKTMCLDKAGTRHSWSPESHNTPELSASPSSAATTRLDFKRLLLQQSTKMGLNKPSAAEQLKLSRQQAAQPQTLQRNQKTTQHVPSIARAMSPRSTWRFQTPRSDVLSSTIIEDAVAEENAIHAARPAKRQLDLSFVASQRPMLGTERSIDNRDLYSQRESDLQATNRQRKTEFFTTSGPPNFQLDRYRFQVRPESPNNQRPSINVNKAILPNSSAPTLETAL